MEIKAFFQKVREEIANEQYQNLAEIDLDQPEFFNWVMDVFCPLNLEPYPAAEALIWRHNEKEKRYTFKSIYATTNQFLNFLHKHGVQQGNCIYTQLPLDPANWIATLGAIKGGLILIPAANNLIEKDIAYRFQTIFPEVVITDLANAAKNRSGGKNPGSGGKGENCSGWKSELAGIPSR